MSKTFTKAEVANFKDEKNGMYIIIDNDVYDIACEFSFSSYEKQSFLFYAISLKSVEGQNCSQKHMVRRG